MAADDRLNMRLGPSAEFPVIGSIPPDGEGVANLGCVGGLDAASWAQASAEQREASRRARWCLVGYDRLVGWAAGRYLAEGAGPDAFRAGAPLTLLRGSEWRVVRLGATAVDAELLLGFKTDGAVWGDTGCNRLHGRFVDTNEAITIGPIATTRRVCPETVMQRESAFIAALESGRRRVSRHLVLVLLDERSAIVAQFARSDWD